MKEQQNMVHFMDVRGASSKSTLKLIVVVKAALWGHQ